MSACASCSACCGASGTPAVTAVLASAPTDSRRLKFLICFPAQPHDRRIVFGQALTLDRGKDIRLLLLACENIGLKPLNLRRRKPELSKQRPITRRELRAIRCELQRLQLWIFGEQLLPRIECIRRASAV